MNGVNITGPRILVEFSLFGLNVRITQTVLSSLIVMVALILLSWRLGRNLTKRPGRGAFAGELQRGRCAGEV